MSGYSVLGVGHEMKVKRYVNLLMNEGICFRILGGWSERLSAYAGSLCGFR